MPTEHRFDELDLREEPGPVAKLDDDADAPTTTVQYTRFYCTTSTC